MKLSSAQAFKFLTSKIHPPLPRTPRESQQLLSVLTSSFRRQLDREHPPVQSAESQASARSLSEDRRFNGPVNADQHLSSVLDHPLFSTVPHQPTLTQKQSIRARGNGGANPLAEDPIIILDRAIASGAVDINTIHDCLCRHRLQIDHLPREIMRDKMRDSKFGSRIISWLSSTDEQSKKDFFRNQLTVRFAMPYMLNGNHRRAVMMWLQEIRRHAPCTSRINEEFTLFPHYIVLYEYICAECKYGDGIVPALQFFMDICQILAPTRNGDTLPFYLLSIASRLAQWICSLPASNAQSIPEDLFDGFSQLFEVGDPSVRTRKYYWKAMLALYHPINPNPKFAADHAETLSRGPPIPKRNHSAFLRLYLEAAQLYIKQAEYAKASRLVSTARDLLPVQGISELRQPRSGPRERALPLINEMQSTLLPT
ncbi:hypothetical protein PRK78_000558 [Emydomyces testavorans]|uniref:Uncharacterized protein n=1 Tax=Emydomyces testavorans TaxID=2070801 RepID=A0AAF0DBQ4_9EURO|nr:hypothetical protein PRK78_000558 [Emydomyces testavorans]